MIEYISKFDNLEVLDSNDTSSIISIKVRSESGQFMNKKELYKVFEKMGEQIAHYQFLDQWGDELMTKCQIGQPVQISDQVGVLRVALGSDSLRDIIDDFKSTIE